MNGKLIVLLIVIAGVVGVGWYLMENGALESDWTWTLVSGDNEVVFTEEQLDCSGTSPEEVFQSIDGDYTHIFEDGSWDSYVYGRPINTLSTIKAGVIYYVYIPMQDSYTLTIERC